MPLLTANGALGYGETARIFLHGDTYAVYVSNTLSIFYAKI